MTNILLVFLNQLKNEEECSKVIDEFAENNYKIFVLDNIKKDEYFSFDSLPVLVQSYKEEFEDLNKITVLSNSRDLLFSWYRCYNSVVDDFVYFVDEDDCNYFDINDEHFPFYYNLYEFNGIDKETVRGKIYLSQFRTSSLPISYNLKSFDNLENYDYIKTTDKEKINKKYIYNRYEYVFENEQNIDIEKVKIGKINKRIVFIKGQSQYDVLRIGIDKRANYFKQLGFDVDILDLLENNIQKNINEKIVNKKTDFIYSNNCIGIDIELTDGRNLYDALNIPFIGRLGDHPVNQISRVINSPMKTVFLCLDLENIRYFNKKFPDKKIIMMNGSATYSKSYKKVEFSKRKIDILFAGTVINPQQIRDSWYMLDEKTKKIIDSVIQENNKNKKLIDIDDEISKAYLKYNIKDDNLNYKSLIHSYIERYIRVYKRYELVKKIGESGLEVVCIGNIEEYKKLNKSGKLIIRDRVSYNSLLELMNQSKMVLNITGHLYNGITERVVSAMMNGAVAITERDRFTESNFKDMQNIILYDLDNVVNKIKYSLKNIERLSQIALNGQKEAQSKYDYRISLSKLPRYIYDI